ncbi:MurT ligase domain-containing protein [Desulfotomaculum defluvii]
MNIRLSLAVMVAKFAAFVSRKFGWKGSSLPGVVARKLYKNTLKDLAGQARQGVIMVTGTNGKTTTNNMIANIIQTGGYRVVINQEGANLITGVTAAFVKYANYLGKLDCDFALLEVDEASFPKVVQEVKPQFVVVNNFFRDQLDRYGELDTTVKLVREALKTLPQVHLILNTDDPLVAQMQSATGHDTSYFGLSSNLRIENETKQTRESRFCPHCGNQLHYDSYQYSQLGSYSCFECGFKRQEPEVEALAIDNQGTSLKCHVRYPQGQTTLTINTQGFYNLYNALAAFCVGYLIGIDIQQIQQGLLKYKPAIGRMETFEYHGKRAILNLVKNPTGFNEGISTLLSIPGSKSVFIAINDNDADGRDISWLWDVDFEHLANGQDSITNFTCSGLRGEEMALRLKYAGVPMEKITVVRDMARAIQKTLEDSGESAYLFSTYTALWSAQKILLGLAGKEEDHVKGLSSVS